MNINALVDFYLLEAHVEDGNIRVQEHPVEPLAILNYTQQAQFARVWDAVTRQCRGLIYNTTTGEIVARPFPKFFNYGEHERPVEVAPNGWRTYHDDVVHAHLDPDAPCVVTDKMDGSLGILYPCGIGPCPCVQSGASHACACVGGEQRYAIATRGSFTSDQAMHATRIYVEKYADNWVPDPEYTYLFEIIYPANRIVLDYGPLDDLVLIGLVHNETGKVLGHDADPNWPGPTNEYLPATTLREALELPVRPNAEGVVVRFEDDLLIKIKQDDYVQLHKLIFGLSEKRVWEMLRDGFAVEQIQEPLPEEFHDWISDVRIGLQFRADKIWLAARDGHEAILADMCGRVERRGDYAALAKGYTHPGLLFSLLDGKDIRPAIWQMVKPQGQGTFNRTPQTEDVA